MSITETIKKKLTKEEAEKDGKAEPSVKARKEAKGAKDITEEEKKAFAAIVQKPRVTEKTTMLESGRTYTFNVHPDASKFAVKRIVERTYGVTVLDVRTITIPRKKRMRGKMEGWKRGYKKALVKVKEGQSIELQ